MSKQHGTTQIHKNIMRRAKNSIKPDKRSWESRYIERHYSLLLEQNVAYDQKNPNSEI